MEEKNIDLISILEGQGYDKESAKKCVEDVLEARRICRENYLKNYLGKRVRADFGGLIFEIIIKDVKIDHEGKTQFQVSPLNGSKSVWISSLNLIL